MSDLVLAQILDSILLVWALAIGAWAAVMLFSYLAEVFRDRH